MARGSRSRASRAERRMQKERAESALQRGLPVPTPRPKSIASSARMGSKPPGRSRSPSHHAASSGPGIPLAVKLLGLGLGLLGLVYGLTLFRDHQPLPGPAAVPASMTGAAK